MQTIQHPLTQIPEGFFWFNEPRHYFFEEGLNILTSANTDFWQGTHYGFRRDNGHALLTRTQGDFTLSTQTEFEAKTKYDQCGLLARVDSRNWIKCSVEYENADQSRLGSVVTHLGYSDWATQDVSSNIRLVGYRLSRRGQDFLLEYALEPGDWRQMRVAHLHEAGASLAVGIYACSPLGENFHCRFRFISLDPNRWHAE